MPAGTLGPLAQQVLHRPPATAATPSLLERGRLAARHFEPTAAVERLRALASSKTPVAHEGFLPELGFIVGEEPETGPVLPIVEIRAREPRRRPSTLAEKRAVAPARRESPMPEPDVHPFVMAVRELVETERITAARHMLDVAPAYILCDPIVARLRSVLAPPIVKRVKKRDVDRRQEYEWLRAHAHEYRGRWVALVRGSLLACAPTLRELKEQLRTMDLLRPPLLHRVD